MGRIDHLLAASAQIHDKNLNATDSKFTQANTTAQQNIELKATESKNKIIIVAIVGVALIVFVKIFLTKRNKKK